MEGCEKQMGRQYQQTQGHRRQNGQRRDDFRQHDMRQSGQRRDDSRQYDMRQSDQRRHDADRDDQVLYDVRRSGQRQESRNAGRQNPYRKDAYEYQRGTAVREPSFEELLEEAPKKKPNHTARKNREKAVQMNFGYVVFLVGALALTAVVLIRYINLQSDITNSVKRVSRMESELHALRQDNDEYENRINSSVDLEEVKRIAICELGMKYASEGQIIRVAGGGDDYARKYAEIPKD